MPSGWRISGRSRFLRHNFPSTPHVDRRSISAGGLARRLTSAPEGAANRSRKFFTVVFSVLRFHALVSKSFGLLPELSYTAQASACNSTVGNAKNTSHMTDPTKRFSNRVEN